MRRFHLLSFMAALLTASVLVGVNTLVYTQTIESITPPLNEELLLLPASRAYGWPITAIQHKGYVIRSASFERTPADPIFAKIKREMDQNPHKSTRLDGQTYTRIPEGVLTLFQLEFNGWAIVANTALLLACSAAALFICEHLAHRRDAGKKPKVAA